MKRRFTFDPETGHLIDRDGEALGVVVGLTLDSRPMVLGGKGGFSGGTETASSSAKADEGRGVGEPSRPTASQLEREAVERVWTYWLEVSGRNQRLDEKRKRIIRGALATIKAADSVGLEEAEAKAQRALLGLSRSPWHRGDNEMRKQYLEIRYALKGRGDESDDERIEKACDWAAVYAPEGKGRSLDPDKALRYLEEIREYIGRLEHDRNAITGRDRALEAFRKLAAAGYEVVRIDRAPWARFA